jgi:hypothetical protein
MDFRLWLENYRGNHTPPGKGSGSPLHDLSDTYPDDIYGPNAVTNYGSIQISFYIDDRLKISTGYLSDFALQRIKENPNYKRMMGEKVADNPNYSPSKIWAEIPKPSWKDALRKKVEPGGVAKLPYESVLI